MKFTVSHKEKSKFEAGLRGFFQYRDLGIDSATNGNYGANVIRQGTFTFHEGDSVLQPPQISHREIEHSEDLELLEITSPASFDTETV